MIYRSMWGLPGWRSRSPFDELERMRRQMERLSDIFSDRAPGIARAGVFPPVNLTEDRDNYYLRAELPGIQNADIDLQVTEKSISLSGERKIGEAEDKVRFHRREREAGTFSRIVSLPGDIDPNKVEASLVNGILTVKVPKVEAVKPRQIEVRQP